MPKTYEKSVVLPAHCGLSAYAELRTLILDDEGEFQHEQCVISIPGCRIEEASFTLAFDAVPVLAKVDSFKLTMWGHTDGLKVEILDDGNGNGARVTIESNRKALAAGVKDTIDEFIASCESLEPSCVPKDPPWRHVWLRWLREVTIPLVGGLGVAGTFWLLANVSVLVLFVAGVVAALGLALLLARTS